MQQSTFFHKLDEETRDDSEQTLTALKDHFYKSKLKEIYHINWENLEISSKRQSPEVVIE